MKKAVLMTSLILPFAIWSCEAPPATTKTLAPGDTAFDRDKARAIEAGLTPGEFITWQVLKSTRWQKVQLEAVKLTEQYVTGPDSADAIADAVVYKLEDQVIDLAENFFKPTLRTVLTLSPKAEREEVEAFMAMLNTSLHQDISALVVRDRAKVNGE